APRSGHRVEEQAAEDVARPLYIGDRDQNIAADLVVEVVPQLVRRDRLRAQHGAGGRIDELNLLAPRAVAVPVEEVELQLVGLAVGAGGPERDRDGVRAAGGGEGMTSRQGRHGDGAGEVPRPHVVRAVAQPGTTAVTVKGRADLAE